MDNSNIVVPSERLNNRYLVLTTISTILFATLSVILLLHLKNLSKEALNTAVTEADNYCDPGAPYSVCPLTHTRIGGCDKSQCLFQGVEGPEGLARLSGYYIKYESESWGDQKITCDGFVITGGNQFLINHINDWIANGNTLNKVIDGKLVTNLLLESLDDTTAQRILSSTQTQPIELLIVRTTPWGHGASPCDNIVDVIKVENIVN